MIINIQSQVDYEIEMSVYIKNEMQQCIEICGNEKRRIELGKTEEKVRLSFAEPEGKSFFAKLLSGIFTVIFNFAYYCFSYEEIKAAHPISHFDQIINTILIIKDDGCAKEAKLELNILYKVIKLFDGTEIGIGILEENKHVECEYELNEIKFEKQFALWYKQTKAFLAPGMIIIIFGFLLGIRTGYYIFALLMGMLFVFFAVSIYNYLKKVKLGKENYISLIRNTLKRL